MIDIRLLRQNPDYYVTKSQQKGYSVDIPALLELDKSRRQLNGEIDQLRKKRNQLTAQTKGQRPSDQQVKEGRQIKEELTAKQQQYTDISDRFEQLLQAIPNPADDSAPVGGEEDSVEVSAYGGKSTGAVDHLDYATARGWVDFERGAKVAGNKFYYLKGDLALLEQALIQYGISFVSGRGFNFMTVPHVVSSRIATGAGFAPRSSEEGNEYYLEGEDLSLIGTAEAPLTGYHADEIIDEADLPLCYAGLSPCYRREAGTYGKHSRGLFRVHQFNKLELYVFSLPEKSQEMHERILAVEEELWQSLKIPYRVINIASGDLGAPAAKKYDIEYWSKVDGAYRELTSCSNCTDFQARNLAIRTRRADGQIEPLHTLNGTAISLARSLIAIIEHYQNDDGSLSVPEALRPYMGGRQKL